jgi:hypothetical protein
MSARNSKVVVEMNPVASMSDADLRALVAKQAEEIQALKQRGQKGITHRASPKGGYQVAGLNKQFPITLYAEQWARLFDAMPSIVEGIEKARELNLLSSGKEETDEEKAARQGRYRDRYPTEYASYLKQQEVAAKARAAKG